MNSDDLIAQVGPRIREKANLIWNVANSLAVKNSDRFHDRFLILDRSVLIHVGASLNYHGKRCFAFSSLDKSNIPDILAKL